jgi:hypothetical protein
LSLALTHSIRLRLLTRQLGPMCSPEVLQFNRAAMDSAKRTGDSGKSAEE